MAQGEGALNGGVEAISSTQDRMVVSTQMHQEEHTV
jgi:hypothetical protein